MNEFEQFLSKTADVPPRRIPHYLRWVRRAYDMVDASLQAPLPSEDMTRVTRRLQQNHEKWQVNQARRALQLYRYFLASSCNSGCEDEPKSHSHDGEWQILVEKTRNAMRHEE